MAEYKYGTNFTSVKVSHAPGGNSSLNLAWDTSSQVNSNLRNSEKRNAMQDPFKSRDGARNMVDQDDYGKYDKNLRSNPITQIGYTNIKDYQNHQNFKQVFQDKPTQNVLPTLNFGENYFHKQDDLYKGPEFQGQNYFKTPEVPEVYMRNEDWYPRETNLMGPKPNQYSQHAMVPRMPEPENFGHRQENPYAREPPQYNLPPKHPQNNNYYKAPQAYPPQMAEYNKNSQNEDRRNAPGYIKNSVRVSNPPGGQSSIMFG